LSIWGQTKPENPKRGSAVFLKAVKQAPKKAADGYRNAAGLQPDSVVTAVKLFTTFNQQNKIGEQKSRVEIIEKLMPGHSVVKLFWGLICYSEKDFSTAKNYWRLIHLYQKNWGDFVSWSICEPDIWGWFAIICISKPRRPQISPVQNT